MRLQDAYICTICRDDVTDTRGQAKLQCGDLFHLDCIHREFSAKGEMRCPNCRNVETSQWPFPNSPRPSNELNVDGLLNRGDRIDPEAPQFQSEGFGRGLAYAVLDSPTEGLGYYASLTNQPYPYSTTLAEGHVGWSSNQPQFQFGGFSRGDAAAAAAA
ncbi:E3 ubiquitin-protein ligase RFI2-like [Helianthus annuus]|uniref:E3 ubiquitin-protein ligase RFI2-like n=1 Tax=Helianthus annuus TaxID=4232 RepID=UPI001652D19F|nr:E3 ubiquitin-protein ligase RFI2-like [Helianthus annuus]